MSAETFQRALKLTLRFEGGYQCRREDSGNWTGGKVGVGELRGTKYGISAASYPDLDILELTPGDAGRIYERDFWRAARCDQLPPLVAIAHFDAVVNMGTGGGGRVLQRAVGVRADGVVGPLTLGAVHGQAERDVVEAMLLERIRAYVDIVRARPAVLTELPGWVLRVVQLGEALMAEDW